MALIALQQLIADGYLLYPTGAHASAYLSGIVTAICDSLATSSEPNFQTEALQLLKAILKRHLALLGLDSILEITVACFRVPHKRIRLGFLQSFVEIVVLGPAASAPVGSPESGGSPPLRPRRAPSNTSQRPRLPSASDLGDATPEVICRQILWDVSESALNGALFEPMLLRWQNLSVFDQRFAAVCEEMTSFLFARDPHHHRQLACLMLVLCKVVLLICP